MLFLPIWKYYTFGKTFYLPRVSFLAAASSSRITQKITLQMRSIVPSWIVFTEMKMTFWSLAAFQQLRKQEHDHERARKISPFTTCNEINMCDWQLTLTLTPRFVHKQLKIQLAYQKRENFPFCCLEWLMALAVGELGSKSEPNIILFETACCDSESLSLTKQSRIQYTAVLVNHARFESYPKPWGISFLTMVQ